jgi:methylmalonyl-CoA mutase N-terminal domain/subunit
VDDELEQSQIELIQKVRNDRDQNKVDQCLTNLRKAASGNENVMPYIVEAVKAYDTVGEIANVIREEFGEYNGM